MKGSTLFVSDRPVEEDAAFSFGTVIHTMEEFIASAADDAPLNICVSGSWGSGKTTLLKGVEARFAQAAERSDPADPETEFVTIWFDPWKLGSEDEVRNALARAVLKVIEDDSSFATQAEIGIERRNVLRMLSDRFLQVSPDDVSAFYRADTRMKDTFAEVEDIFRRVAEVYLNDAAQPRRLIVFVDDLDRCRPARVTEVLESVKLFFDLPGLIFIFALDTEQLERSVADDYNMTPAEARVYLEKIFQLTIPLPRKRTADLRHFLDQNLERIGVEIANPKLSAAVVERYGRNLRKLKLFINWFSFQRRLVGEVGAIEEESLFRWLYLESTMEKSIHESLAEGAVEFVIALEFLAHGGFLHDPDKRDEYLGHLSGSSLNFLALIAFAIITSQDEVETPHATLNVKQEEMVAALKDDGALTSTLKVIREGNQLLIDNDLRQMIFLTRSEEAGTKAEGSTNPAAKKQTSSLHIGNPWLASEWDRLGDSLMTAGRYPEAGVSYVIAATLEPGSTTYIADLARVYRMSNQFAAAHELLARAFEKVPTSSYVLVELAYFFDLGLVEEEFANLIYKRAILCGSKNSTATYYLAMNLEKFGQDEDAYLACLDAVIGDFESPLKQDRLLNLSRKLGRNSGPERRSKDELEAELGEAESAGRYPLPLSESDEREIVERVVTRTDPELAAEELSRPPF